MTEATRRRPFRGLLRTLRRTRELVVEPGLPPGDATRVARAIDEVLAQPETDDHYVRLQAAPDDELRELEERHIEQHQAARAD